MDIMLNNLLNLNEEEIKNSKIEFNMKAGRDGEAFIDRWLKNTNEDKANGTCKECSYWGWYGKQARNFYPNQIVFSFARLAYNEWILISVAKIINVPEDDWAKVEVIEKYKSLFGRLVIVCNKGDTFSRYVFNLSKYIEKAIVKEILPCIYDGEKFNGYDNVNLPYEKLANIFNGKISPTYYEALNKITGVYCLTDTKTGKLYIGSATGEGGVAQRWGNYFNTKHGGNEKLIELYKKEGEEYFKKNFTYTILEYFGISCDVERVKIRERYWKKCLDTIKNGYNDNY